jgi:hypothetical protein
LEPNIIKFNALARIVFWRRVQTFLSVSKQFLIENEDKMELNYKTPNISEWWRVGPVTRKANYRLKIGKFLTKFLTSPITLSSDGIR